MTASQIFDLTGRVALVTGASSGLGVRFAEVLAENGAAVALVARRADRLAAVKARIEAAGGRAVAIGADVLDRKAMVRAFDEAEKAFGTVTILVNNAGVAHSTRAVELTEEEWRRVVGTNLDAVFFWSQEAARRMLAAKKTGAIVNIASVLGLAVSKGTVAYAVAKAGVIQLTKTLGLELAFKGIRVNAIAPGWIVTDLNRDFLLERAWHGDQARDPGRPLRRGARSRRRAFAIGLGRRPFHRRHHHRGRRRPTGGDPGLRRGTQHGLYAAARDRRHPPAHARIRRAARHAARGRSRRTTTITRTFGLTSFANCRRRRAPQGCGRRRRRRSTAGLGCRSSAGRRCTRRRTARSSGRSRSTARRRTMAT